jgi:hypothetical protein
MRAARAVVVSLAAAGATLATLAANAAEATVTREGPMLYVGATVDAAAPVPDCYVVLTDFERLSEFVPGIRSSKVVSQPGEMLKIEQVGVAGPSLLGLTVRTTLGLTLTPPVAGAEARVDFGAFGGNLRQMHGAWVVRENKAGCRIEYRATIEPNFPVPPLIGPFVMRRQVEAQLDAISREIERRHKMRGAEAPPATVVTPME